MAIRADIGAARLVCAQLQMLVQHRGYFVALTGSTLYKGEGRDIDVVLLPKDGRIGSASPRFVADLIHNNLDADVFLEDHIGGEVGLKFEYHGLVVDVAILKRRSETIVVMDDRTSGILKFWTELTPMERELLQHRHDRPRDD